MNWCWLWLLWPLVGILSFGWLSHMSSGLSELIPDDNALEKAFNIVASAAFAPVILSFACLGAVTIESRYRWGLKFW